MSNSAQAQPVDPQAKPTSSTPIPDQEQDDLWQNKALRCMEFGIVLCIVLVVLLTAVYLVCWACSGKGEEGLNRFIRIIRGMNNNWKVSLGILLPLFYRPLRKFLVNLKKVTAGPVSGESGTPSGQQHDYGKKS